MQDILVVYKQVSMQFDESGNILMPEEEPRIHTVSCDEKPGIQATAITSDDRSPSLEHGSVYRDYEYKCLGTLSLIAGINLIESFFSNMTKQMLKGIRVQSKEEVKDRIYKYFEEVNREPVVFHWTYKLDEISVEEVAK